MTPDYTWQEEGYRLDLEYAFGKETNGSWRDYYHYRFFDTTISDEPLFEGVDFSPSPQIDSEDYDRMRQDLLGFISLQPGDTDPDFFEIYTPQQSTWATSYRAENLSIYTEEDDELS